MNYLQRADNYVASLGLEAYRVGGSVRDELLGRRCKDADYMVRHANLIDLQSAIRKTGAKPSALKLRDGRTVGYRANQKGLGLIEIVLPRTEVSTGLGHRDFMIVADPELSLEEDAYRRDFTFNALYKHLETEALFDPTGRGVDDLHYRRISVTHADSFRDDPLRILRALRMLAVLGFDLDKDTLALMMLHADAVHGLTDKGVSGTVLDEFNRLLMGPNAVDALRIARDTGVLARVFPELEDMLGFEQGSKYHDLTTDEHTFEALLHAVRLNASLRVRWALLFHDSGKPAAAWPDDEGRLHYYANPSDDNQPLNHEQFSELLWGQAAARLNFPRDLRNDVATLVREHMVTGSAKASKVNRNRVKFGDELYRDLLLHRACDIAGKGEKSINHNHLKKVAEMERLRQKAQDDEIPIDVGDLQINGHDAIEAGLSGKKIGQALRQILDEIVVQPDDRKLSRDWQLARLEAIA